LAGALTTPPGRPAWYIVGLPCSWLPCPSAGKPAVGGRDRALGKDGGPPPGLDVLGAGLLWLATASLWVLADGSLPPPPDQARSQDPQPVQSGRSRDAKAAAVNGFFGMAGTPGPGPLQGTPTRTQEQGAGENDQSSLYWQEQLNGTVKDGPEYRRDRSVAPRVPLRAVPPPPFARARGAGRSLVPRVRCH